MVAEFLISLSLAAVWLGFLICLLVILFTGTKLSRYGDIIAVRTGLGGAWIGLVLLAVVTSFPELVTGLSAIIVVDAPDLAVGAVLGSCIYNLLIIAILDFVYRAGSIYSGIQHSHSLSAGFGIVLLGALASAMFVQKHFAPMGFGSVGPYAIIAPVVYLIGMRSVFFFERRENQIYTSGLVETVQARRVEPLALRLPRVYVLFGINAVVLMAAATALPVIGEALGTIMGWDETFVGTIFLALVTSVPEVVISVQAVRIGAVDLAIGGLLGSNLFDLVILAIEDFVYLDGPILHAASDQHLLTAIAALTMTGIAIVGLCARPRARVFRVVAWTSLGLLAVGLFSALILFLLSP
ncbi:MAG: sodium:calcium antiporter [Gemmatimonadota bacterium]|nr:MAG: sodium:calcium antiporter [Gemmatimonadota bacterium]